MCPDPVPLIRRVLPSMLAFGQTGRASRRTQQGDILRPSGAQSLPKAEASPRHHGGGCLLSKAPVKTIPQRSRSNPGGCFSCPHGMKSMSIVHGGCVCLCVKEEVRFSEIHWHAQQTMVAFAFRARVFRCNGQQLHTLPETRGSLLVSSFIPSRAFGGAQTGPLPEREHGGGGPTARSAYKREESPWHPRGDFSWFQPHCCHPSPTHTHTHTHTAPTLSLCPTKRWVSLGFSFMMPTHVSKCQPNHSRKGCPFPCPLAGGARSHPRPPQNSSSFSPSSLWASADKQPPKP